MKYWISTDHEREVDEGEQGDHGVDGQERGGDDHQQEASLTRLATLFSTPVKAQWLADPVIAYWNSAFEYCLTSRGCRRSR